MGDDRRGIVIDNGSAVIKGGYAGDEAPQVSIPSVVGRPRFANVMQGTRSEYVGSRAQDMRGLLTLRYPIQNGVVTNWDDMEKIWFWMFNEGLRAAPEDHPVFLTDSLLNPRANREKMMQIMFETFNVPAFYAVDPAALSLYGSGRTTGLIVNSGEGVTSIVPIYGTYLIDKAIHRSNLAGRDITEYLQRILTERGYYLTTTAEHEIVRDIKEKFGYVALDLDAELLKATCMVETERKFKMDGCDDIPLSNERFRCTEAMFRPSLLGKESMMGVHEMVYNAIMKSDIDLRKDLWQNIVLSGGNTMFPGFAERLQKELHILAPHFKNIKIHPPMDWRNDLLAWVGGSIWASLACFQQMWLSKVEYDEKGPSIFHRIIY